MPQKSVKVMITDLLTTEDEDINEIIICIFKELCQYNCHYECIKLLIDSGKIDVTVEDNCAIKKASEFGHTEIVRLLLLTGKVDVTTKDNYAIKYASSNGHLEVVKLLLSTGKVDVTAQDNWPIRYASYGGHLDVVRCLLSTGQVDVTAQNNCAIRQASQNGHLDVVQCLLSTGQVDVTAKDNWALKVASRNGHSDIIRLLLSTGKIDTSKISDVNILRMQNQIKSENKTIDVNAMAKIMKSNNISKIVIENGKIEYTMRDIMGRQSPEIIQLMNEFSVFQCVYDNESSDFEYRTKVKIMNIKT